MPRAPVTWEVREGDCRALLRDMPAQSVHCVVTSPPYFRLRDYGVDGQIGLEEHPDDYAHGLLQTADELHRVLRDDGTFWLNLGDTYSASGGGRQHDYLRKKAPPGMDVNTSVGSRSGIAGLPPKNLLAIPWRVALALQGFAVLPRAGAATWASWLKEAREAQDWELVTLVEEHLRRTALLRAVEETGWVLRSGIVWDKPNILPEPVTDRPTLSHEFIFLFAKRRTYYFDGHAIKEAVSDSMLAAAASGREREDKEYKHDSMVRDGKRSGNRVFSDADSMLRVASGRNRRTVWRIPTRPFRGAHFATFPPELPEPCIKAGTSEHGCCSACGAPFKRELRVVGRIVTDQMRVAGGDEEGEYHGESVKDYDTAFQEIPGEAKQRILEAMSRVYETVGWNPTCACGEPENVTPAVVLDPFAGSGTTGVAATRLGRSFLGLELNPENVLLARQRIRDEGAQNRRLEEWT